MSDERDKRRASECAGAVGRIMGQDQAQLAYADMLRTLDQVRAEERALCRAKADALAEALRDVLNWGHAPSVHDLIDDLERRMDRAAAVLTAYDGETGG